LGSDRSLLRGSNFREGYHDYTIRTGGLAYPRLIASEHMPGFQRKAILSGLPELDQLLRGGLDSGTSSLLIGPAGCGKSTIVLRYAYTSAQRGEKAVIFTFDESLSTLIGRAKHLGMDPTELIASRRLEIH
jgi:circadian clock protein KaiC